MCHGDNPNCHYRCSGCPEWDYVDEPDEVLLDMICTDCEHMFQIVGKIGEETGLRIWSPATCPKCGSHRIKINDLA